MGWQECEYFFWGKVAEDDMAGGHGPQEDVMDDIVSIIIS